MTPPKADTPRLLDALRLLETTWRDDLAIVVDKRNGRTWLSRSTTEGGEAAHWSTSIIDDGYVCFIETVSGKQKKVYPSFIAAVYAFAGKPLTPEHAAAMTQAAEKLAARL